MKTLNKMQLLVAAAISLVASALPSTAPLEAAEITPTEAQEIAKEAYIYGFPMVMHYKTMMAYTLNDKSPEYKAPFN